MTPSLTEELRRAQAELEELRLLLAGAEEQLWAFDFRTGHLRVSRAFETLVGHARGELEQTFDAWKRLCHPEDLARLDDVLRDHVEGRTPYADFDYRARHKDGTWIPLRSRSKVVARDAAGQPLRVVGTLTDLSDLKRSEARLSALLEAIPDLIFRLHRDGTYLDFSCSTAERTLLSPEHFIGQNMRDVPLPRPIVELSLAHLERTLREGTLGVFEYEMELPGGRQAYEARIVRSGPDEAVSIIRNVTERRLLEEQRKQLAQAEKLASLGQLAAGIAHEINNPVSYVKSNLDQFERDAADLIPLLGAVRELLKAPAGTLAPAGAEPLARLRELWTRADGEGLLTRLPEVAQESLMGVRRIREIVDGLRLFAREDAQPESVDLNAELETTLRLVWSELKYKCEVKRDLGPLPVITGHPGQLAQVFTNLLVNAAQAIETWGRIDIRTRQEGGEVRVEISDTGQGMTPETQAHLFTPFFTTKPRGQGTGLGLSICRDIVKRHGGRIEVRSEPGQGSTFTVCLPGPA